MTNYRESFSHPNQQSKSPELKTFYEKTTKPIFDLGFPTATTGSYEIVCGGKKYIAIIVDCYDPEAVGLCWELPNGTTIHSEQVSEIRKIS